MTVLSRRWPFYQGRSSQVLCTPSAPPKLIGPPARLKTLTDDEHPSWQSPLPDTAPVTSSARSEAQTLKGRDRKRATQADLLFAMAKQYMMPLLRRLTNLRTKVATGRTRNHYGVGRELTGEELSRRKTEIARLERWTGRAKKTSVRRTPARHCACSALLDFLHGLPPSTTA